MSDASGLSKLLGLLNSLPPTANPYLALTTYLKSQVIPDVHWTFRLHLIINAVIIGFGKLRPGNLA